MTDGKILDKAITKAVKNGYVGFNVKIIKEVFIKNKWDFEDEKYFWYYGIIFDPKFAKAYWGEEEGINKVDFIYSWFNADCQKCTIKDFLINHTKEELNLLLDKQKHVFNGITFLGEVTYYKEFEGWQYHQHQMLDEIQEGRNSLLYLEKFL